MSMKTFTIVALASGLASIASAQSGSGVTTRYWDCCKPSCAWSGKAQVSSPVAQCNASGNKLTAGDDTQKSGCDSGGDAYMCNDQTPWMVNENLAYGFAAVSLTGGSDDANCCACYELSFTSGPVSGKKMIVQATNTGSDLGTNQFDLAIPGGGLGIFDACSTILPGADEGARYGGVSSASSCSSWGPLAGGCNFRFGWFESADNPSVDYKRVACPAELTARTGCKRDDDSSAPAADVAAAPASSAASSYIAPSSSAASSYVAPSSSAAFTYAPTSSTTSSYVAPAATSSAASPSTSTGSEKISAPAATLPVETESPVMSSTTSTAAAPTGSASCGQKGYDLQKPPTSFFDGSGNYATFDTCKSLCTTHSAKSFAFGDKQCLCYPAPVAGNLNPVADSPITFYDIGCTADAVASSSTVVPSSTVAASSSTAAASSSTLSTYSAATSTVAPIPSSTAAPIMSSSTPSLPSPTGYVTPTTSSSEASPETTDAPESSSVEAAACPVTYLTVYDDE